MYSVVDEKNTCSTFYSQINIDYILNLNHGERLDCLLLVKYFRRVHLHQMGISTPCILTQKVCFQMIRHIYVLVL